MKGWHIPVQTTSSVYSRRGLNHTIVDMAPRLFLQSGRKKILVQVTAVNAQKSLCPIIIQFPRHCNGSSFNRITQGGLLIIRCYYLAE